MASNHASQVISETAKAEGGPQKGSTSAQMQSEVARQRNAEQTNNVVGSEAQSVADKQANLNDVASDIGSKMTTDPTSITSEDASTLESRESRAMGGIRPPSGSMAAEVKHVASMNEQGRSPVSSSGVGDATQPASGRKDPQTQSEITRERNFEEQAQLVGFKLATDPGSVSKEDADIMHRREQRAHGHTEKGGISAQAQAQAAKNMGDTTPTQPLTSEQQSQLTKERNFQQEAQKVGDKLANAPESVTPQEADTLHSREHRAHGATEKGGIASQAQAQAAENTGNTK